MEIAFVGSADKISYVYNGEGKKIEKKVTQGTTETTTKYLEGFQYKKINGATDVLQFFPTAEGYVKKTGTSNYNYVFNHKDHLGNIRLSYQDLDNNGTIATSEIIEENHYYPFGLKHSYNSSAMGDYKYKYSGKEYQDELGLNMYDYGARNYDPVLGRWNGIDLLAEKYHPLSPYSFVANDPVKYKDAQGMDIVDRRGGSNQLIIIDENGQLQWTQHASSQRNSGAVQVLTEMLKTDKGRQVVMNLVRCKTKTNISLIKGSTYQNDFIIDNEKKLRIVLGFTSYVDSEIKVDENGQPYFDNATIKIYSSSFNIMNGDRSSLPSWAQDNELVQTVDIEPYEDFGKFLNGVGTHEGTHVLNDMLEAMSDAGVDEITVEGKEAKKLFQSIIKSYNNLNAAENAPLETVPRENEEESNQQYKK